MSDEPAAQRPKLHHFLAERGWDHYHGAALIGCSGEYVRRMCLPLHDPRRCVPSRRLRQTIAERTDGKVGLDDWAAGIQGGPQ